MVQDALPNVRAILRRELHNSEESSSTKQKPKKPEQIETKVQILFFLWNGKKITDYTLLYMYVIISGQIMLLY